MIFLNIAMAVFFGLLGVAVCYIAEEQKFDECIKDWIGMHKADIDQQWALRERISELESELKKEREEYHPWKNN
jgi:adenosyl cobinamide kinase/adenosyl cobinamide phosphate guanylyltransferase